VRQSFIQGLRLLFNLSDQCVDEAAEGKVSFRYLVGSGGLGGLALEAKCGGLSTVCFTGKCFGRDDGILGGR
jgi:hypothetical protein